MFFTFGSIIGGCDGGCSSVAVVLPELFADAVRPEPGVAFAFPFSTADVDSAFQRDRVRDFDCSGMLCGGVVGGKKSKVVDFAFAPFQGLSCGAGSDGARVLGTAGAGFDIGFGKGAGRVAVPAELRLSGETCFRATAGGDALFAGAKRWSAR